MTGSSRENRRRHRGDNRPGPARRALSRSVDVRHDRRRADMQVVHGLLRPLGQSLRAAQRKHVTYVRKKSGVRGGVRQTPPLAARLKSARERVAALKAAGEANLVQVAVLDMDERDLRRRA